ncbi:sensor domain-containing diguanylate cyclase [Marinobacter xestospongiae]|uniref:sensor domain-containing diguanylate cyclase n=1 Tax=Marinobacter xestospongiae TaxID=994319 RepID=UPI0020060912|nr:sensor domain-containing diguanylate cyclase [Marinobacter xestospongiae]MCK7565598.1 sensor domain-containing diguanylate cyclase [Marinobacter xestospongiae]
MPTPDQLNDVIQLQTDVVRLGPNLGEVMSLVVDRTLELVEADGAVIELLENGEMVYRAASGAAKPYLGLRLQQDASISGLCARTGRALLSNDSETDERVDRAACRKVGLRSMVLVPLKHDGDVIGVLKALSSEPNQFAAADIQLLVLLSDLVASAMYFAGKYDRDELFYRATHDDLTGLANRSLFMDRLRNKLIQCLRSEEPLGVLVIDLDDLKVVNDRHGHQVGDALIRTFAERCHQAARDTDTIARIGGDEFAAVLSPLAADCNLEPVIDRLRDALCQPSHFRGLTLPIRASIGGAVYPEDGREIDVLLDVADRRMYGQKRQRKRATRVTPKEGEPE